MKEKKKGVSVLRWPWNLLLSVALALVLGYFIGYLWSCLLGIALLGWLRRQDPDMPDGSYCMEKTHKRCAAFHRVYFNGQGMPLLHIPL